MNSVWIVYVVYDDLGWHRFVKHVCASHQLAIREARNLGLPISDGSNDFGFDHSLTEYVDIREVQVIREAEKA